MSIFGTVLNMIQGARFFCAKENTEEISLQCFEPSATSAQSLMLSPQSIYRISQLKLSVIICQVFFLLTPILLIVADLSSIVELNSIYFLRMSSIRFRFTLNDSDHKEPSSPLE